MRPLIKLFGGWLLAVALLSGAWLAHEQARAQNMLPLMGVGGTRGTAPAFQGIGDLSLSVGAAKAYWGSRAYNVAYATGSNPAYDVCDSGGTNCITINIGSSGFAANPGATACGGNPCTKVSKWYDQIAVLGTNNCTANPCDLAQATNANRPTLTNSLLKTSPGITCPGTAGVILITANNLSGTLTTFTISMVIQQTTGGTFATGVGSSSLIAGFKGADTAEMFNGSTADIAGVNDNTWHAIQFMFNGASSSAFIDGSATGSLSPGTSSLNKLTSCLRSDTNFPLTGTIMEAGIWSGQFSGGDQSAVNGNQHGATSGWNF